MHRKNLTPLFERQYQITYKNREYLEKLSNFLNVRKLSHWNWKKTYNFLDINFEQEYIGYRFQVLKEWIQENQRYTSNFVNSLNEIISILSLENYLTTQEKNYINEFTSVLFAKNRNIKNLIVDFQLHEKEEVWYTYDILGVYEKTEKYKLIKNNIQIFLTNQRIIFASSGEIYKEIDIHSISGVKLKNNAIEINVNQNNYFIICNEINTVYVSIERVGKLVKLML